MKRITTGLFLLTMLLPVPGIGDEKIVTLATLTDFAPYCFEKDGAPQLSEEIIPPGEDSMQLQGYSWDVVKTSFHEVGYTITLLVVPWERAVHYVKSGKVDAIFPANKTTQREQLFSYSQQYVDRTRIVVYVPVDSDLSWDSLESLNGKGVGVVRGWAYGEKWEQIQGIKKIPTDTIIQGFAIMAKGRLDAVVGYEMAYDHALKDANMTGQFKKLASFDVIDEYLIGLKNSEEILSKINDFDRGNALADMRNSLEAIYQKWLNK